MKVSSKHLPLGLELPPASQASREVANLAKRKNVHTPVFGVKKFVCPSVVNFDPNYLRTGKTEWGKKLLQKKLIYDSFL